MIQTLADIYALPDDHEIKQAFLNKGIGSAYDEFCNRVEEFLLQGVQYLEKNKPKYRYLDEDTLTSILVFGLQQRDFQADHDNYCNGHCDLVVRSGNYEWYGEAKLDKGPGYVMEGFRQLCDRYAPGGPTTNRGGLIVYTRKRNKSKILDVWVKRIVRDYADVSSVNLNGLCEETLTARTSHLHPATGLDFKVRHIPVSFYYKPTDRSARSSRSGGV
ncbi:hypothetical protein [Pseudomonas aeruginosa]|uniref:hypothetical protein n=1 Tax=Pseudomonas aeruginosa TaxID=287 RepID=UPI000AA281C9|nr:hypothetical protein [Pseudomonas aeruginosa]MED8000571.1 hypothetical protein [Pseudomonas aeruginosa]